MLDLEVKPESSLGCDEWKFELGMTFAQAVAIIKSQVDRIKYTSFFYSELNPLKVDLVLNLTNEGVRLIFDPILQRLKIIEVFNMKLLKLRYSGAYFNAPEVLPTIEQIEHAFGATKPIVFDAHRRLLSLNFRGVSFLFPADMSLAPDTASNTLETIAYCPEVSPTVVKMSIYHGTDIAASVPPALPLACFQSQNYLDSLIVKRSAFRYTTGMELNLVAESCSRELKRKRRHFTHTILFGASCQEVLQKLGPPNSVFYKCEDKMLIHRPNFVREGRKPRSDIFFNYYTLGLDLLFDADTLTVKKFILHTNFPGHFNFNTYHRCNFRFQLQCDDNDENNDGGQSSGASSSGTSSHELEQHAVVAGIGKRSRPRHIDVNPFTRLCDLQRHLALSERPVVLHRAHSINTVNPFPAALCYGYQDIIFEVMSTNKYLGAITFYSSPQQQPILPDLEVDSMHEIQLI